MSKTFFKTDRKENFQSRLKRIAFNFFPAYRRTGGRICFLSHDFREVHVKLGLNWRTKNYVGTIFGGSIYGALDPVYMVQLINILKNEYIVWDKSAVVKFLKPIRKTVYARFVITDELLSEIKTVVAREKKYTIQLTAYFQDEEETIYAEVTKTLYIAEKEHYKISRRD
ncbi:MAG TPA: DUF4442 domain-containing protein [Chitinophagaceae bacterium]|nr:DUF4442 domain-containing protein [Chitinophagaceae bacterium]